MLVTDITGLKKELRTKMLERIPLSNGSDTRDIQYYITALPAIRPDA
eukprot:COSAG01_NODE_5225_length_4401_cov_24.113901_2_plen_47_part_00